MKHLLSRDNTEVLAQLAWARVLVAFDFDGTLAPIVANRDEALMRPRTRALFTRVCSLYPCAVISGRAKGDVAPRLGPARIKYVIGNHGLEPGASLEEFEDEITQARGLLAESLSGVAGVDLEDKRYSLALHYRRSRNKRVARAAILKAVEELPMAMRVVPGKLVVNVVPARAPNKGDALLELRAAEQADTALYVGDDVTDEDVFKLDQPGRLVTVRVGEARASGAAYFLRNQQEMDRLLAKLVALREKNATT
ncbi:MAG TPA: trehalose-phosphatase [Kofleriaceae bacterium]|nr:trehalose-phosphatase [Kofleriaceae bacterium]